MNFHPGAFIDSLYYMGVGMLGIMLVIGVIIGITVLLNKITNKKSDKEQTVDFIVLQNSSITIPHPLSRELPLHKGAFLLIYTARELLLHKGAVLLIYTAREPPLHKGVFYLVRCAEFSFTGGILLFRLYYATAPM